MGWFRKSKKKDKSSNPPPQSQGGGPPPPVNGGGNAGGGEDGGSGGGDGTVQYLGDFGGIFNNAPHGGGYNYNGNNRDYYSNGEDLQYSVWRHGYGYPGAPADSWSY